MSEPDPRPPALIVTGGPQDGTTITCDEDGCILGSGETAKVPLVLHNVSAEHAEVVWDGHQLRIRDNGSATGTYLNGEKITEGRALAEGDRIYLGPPGSADSASLLVCPPVDGDGGGDSILLDPPSASPFDSSPIDLSAEAPPIDLGPDTPIELAPEPEPPAAPREPPPPVKATPAPAAAASSATAVAADEPPPRPLPLIPPPKESSARPARSAAPRTSTTAAKMPVPVRRKTGGGLTRPLIVGGGAAAIAVALYFGYSTMHAPPPVLLSVTPEKVEPGGTISLKGQKFAATAGGNSVRIGDGVGEVLSATETDMTVRVPAEGKSGEVPIVVTRGSSVSNQLFCRIFQGPRVTGLQPEVAMPGDSIVILGQHLNAQAPTVTIDGIRAQIEEAQPTSIKARVPPELVTVPGKAVPVSVQVGSEAAKPVDLVLGKLPLLLAVDPAFAPADARVKLKGRGFAADAAGNKVLFGDQVVIVLSASPTELVAVAPGSPAPGSQVPMPVHVEVAGSSSIPTTFTLTRSSAPVFTPRFYPLPVTEHPTHQHVIVATDLGPALILSGKADAAALAERATAVADALNALVDGAVAGQRPALEARETCVGVSGNPKCLVTAVAEDAAAYDETWGQTKGTKAAPRALAAHWAALIDDYITLFVLKQRPARTLETTPRGKTLLELYAAAARRNGAGGGVPTDMVQPLPARLGGELKDLALVLSDDRTARAGAAVEGLWQGTLEEPSGTRAITVRLVIKNGKLGGMLKTGAGGLTMDTPLDSASYERGGLRFVAQIAGERRTFRGELRSGQITGAIHAGDAKDELGHFALNFVE